MGKQAHDKRVSLLNALNSGPAQKPPPKKEPAKSAAEPPPGQGRRKKEPVPEPVQQTRKEIEEAQQRAVADRERERRELLAAEAARKAQECKAADTAVTYVEDKVTQKPKAVNDISDYWKKDLGILPFLPSDNVGPSEVNADREFNNRLDYLQMLNEQLQRLLKMRFNVFWSQMIYDAQLRRCIDLYLRFCMRGHDVKDSEEVEAVDNNAAFIAAEEQKLAREISRRMLFVFLRLSKPQETPHDFISEEKFGQYIYDNGIFDVPKLIDICAIYGDGNRDIVTRIVHSVFQHQPRYREDFKAVVQHMLNGLHQCCAPLQQASPASSGGAAELSVEECLKFLPDVLSCFNAMFCFFPEDCVAELLIGGSLDTALPMAELMVVLHDAVTELKQSGCSAPTRTLDNIVSLLSRLLNCVLGFRMAPRHGAAAFDELLEWLRLQACGRTALLHNLGQYGMENIAWEWNASGLVDDAKFDTLEQFCGASLLPPEARKRGRKAASVGGAAGGKSSPSGHATGSGGSSSSQANDGAKIREIREVVGLDYGEGFVLQCLLHYSGSVQAVIGAIFDGSLPPQLATLSRGLTLRDNPNAPRPVEKGVLLDDDKKRVIEQTNRMDKEAKEREEAREAGEVRWSVTEYDDDFDEIDTGPRLRVGAQDSDSAASSGDEDKSSDDDDTSGARQWGQGKGGHGGKGKGKGKGGKGPVQGQTIQARRKEEHKSSVANHNRRDRALRKMQKGM